MAYNYVYNDTNKDALDRIHTSLSSRVSKRTFRPETLDENEIIRYLQRRIIHEFGYVYQSSNGLLLPRIGADEEEIEQVGRRIAGLVPSVGLPFVLSKLASDKNKYLCDMVEFSQLRHKSLVPASFVEPLRLFEESKWGQVVIARFKAILKHFRKVSDITAPFSFHTRRDDLKHPFSYYPFGEYFPVEMDSRNRGSPAYLLDKYSERDISSWDMDDEYFHFLRILNPGLGLGFDASIHVTDEYKAGCIRARREIDLERAKFSEDVRFDQEDLKHMMGERTIRFNDEDSDVLHTKSFHRTPPSTRLLRIFGGRPGLNKEWLREFSSGDPFPTKDLLTLSDDALFLDLKHRFCSTKDTLAIIQYRHDVLGGTIDESTVELLMDVIESLGERLKKLSKYENRVE